MKSIEMIAHFKKNEIVPIRFRIENTSGELIVVNINKVKYTEIINYNDKKIKFCVISKINGYSKELIIWFYINSNTWYIDV